jgi:hypothetical protein
MQIEDANRRDDEQIATQTNQYIHLHTSNFKYEIYTKTIVEVEVDEAAQQIEPEAGSAVVD